MDLLQGYRLLDNTAERLSHPSVSKRSRLNSSVSLSVTVARERAATHVVLASPLLASTVSKILSSMVSLMRSPRCGWEGRTQGRALVEVDPAIGEELNAFVLQGAGQAAERMGMSIRHIIAVALVDADADPVDAGANGQPGQRKAKSLASIAKLSAGDFV